MNECKYAIKVLVLLGRENSSVEKRYKSIGVLGHGALLNSKTLYKVMVFLGTEYS